MRFIRPGEIGKQAVKARVYSHGRPRSFEVETETGGLFRRNRRLLRRTKEDFNKAGSAGTWHSEVSIAPGCNIDWAAHLATKSTAKMPTTGLVAIGTSTATLIAHSFWSAGLGDLMINWIQSHLFHRYRGFPTNDHTFESI